jgi:hypothetical protein
MKLSKDFFKQVQFLGEGSHYCGPFQGWITVSERETSTIFEISNSKSIGNKGTIRINIRADENDWRKKYFSAYLSNGAYFRPVEKNCEKLVNLTVLKKKIFLAEKFKRRKKEICEFIMDTIFIRKIEK